MAVTYGVEHCAAGNTPDIFCSLNPTFECKGTHLFGFLESNILIIQVDIYLLLSLFVFCAINLINRRSFKSGETQIDVFVVVVENKNQRRAPSLIGRSEKLRHINSESSLGLVVGGGGGVVGGGGGSGGVDHLFLKAPTNSLMSICPSPDLSMDATIFFTWSRGMSWPMLFRAS